MIDLIRFELKKYVINRKNVIWLVVCSLILVIWLIYVTQNISDRAAFSKKVLSDNNYTYTDDLLENLEILKSTSSAEESQSYSYIIKSIERTYVRNKYIYAVRNGEISQSLSFISFFNMDETAMCMIDIDISGIFVKNIIYFMFSLISMIWIISCGYSVEKEKISKVSALALGNNQNINFIKIIVVLGLSIILNVFYGLVNIVLLMIRLKVEINIFNAPLFLIDGFEKCKSGISIGQYLLMQFGCAVIATFFVGLITLLVAKIARNTGIVFFVAALIIAILYGVELIEYWVYTNMVVGDKYYIMSAVTYNKMLKTINFFNPMALLNLKYFYQSPKFLTVGNWVIENIVITVFITVAFIDFLVGIISKDRLYEKRIIVFRNKKNT